MRSKAANSPDYEGMSPQEALADLRQRIANYENAYETVSNVRLSYIKLYDLSSRVLANKIYGRLATSLVPYLMSVHIGTRPIWLVRAGASRSFIPLVDSCPLLASWLLAVCRPACARVCVASLLLLRAIHGMPRCLLKTTGSAVLRARRVWVWVRVPRTGVRPLPSWQGVEVFQDAPRPVAADMGR